MRHIFLINPAAGGGKSVNTLTERIRKAGEARGERYHIHITTHVGDATEQVRALCAEASAEDPIRFYACGGDGTLSEVANGMADCPHAELGLIPCGTGNDFVRNFTENDLFFDIEAQMDGTAAPIDMLSLGDRLCINMINVGFDCEVVCKKDEYNRKPHFPHKLAYIVGVASTFFRMPGLRGRVRVDGGEETEIPMQLTTMANGCFCGGGFRSNPRATLQDGTIDVLQIDPVSRFTFLRLIGSYRAGTHLDGDKNANILRVYKAKRIDMYFDRDQHVCIDGEVATARELHLQIKPAALRFSLPRGTAFRHAAQPREVTV